MPSEEPYRDAKGRVRWHDNDRLAELVKQLGDFLIIAGYEPSHAARYGRLAHTISRLPDPVRELHAQGQLRQLPGVGPTVAGILGELIERGSCVKLETWAREAPLSLLELTRIEGLGPLKIRQLWTERGIDSLAALRSALTDGRLKGLSGFGPATIARLREACGDSSP